MLTLYLIDVIFLAKIYQEKASFNKGKGLCVE